MRFKVAYHNPWWEFEYATCLKVMVSNRFFYYNFVYNTLPETTRSPLKIDPLKDISSCSPIDFQGLSLAVSFREGMIVCVFQIGMCGHMVTCLSTVLGKKGQFDLHSLKLTFSPLKRMVFSSSESTNFEGAPIVRGKLAVSFREGNLLFSIGLKPTPI